MNQWKFLYSMLLSVQSCLWYRWSITNFQTIPYNHLNWDVLNGAYQVSIDFLLKLWRELTQVPRKCASLSICIQRSHWYLCSFKWIYSIISSDLIQSEWFIFSYIICEASHNGKEPKSFWESVLKHMKNWSDPIENLLTCNIWFLLSIGTNAKSIWWKIMSQ